MTASPANDISLDVAFATLAEPERRYLLSILSDHVESVSSSVSTGDPVSLETLTTSIASNVYAHPIVTDDQWTQTHRSLVHAHLPELEGHGIVNRTDRGETTTVSLCSHPLLGAEWVRALLSDPTGGTIDDESVLDRTLEVLRSDRRRTVCTVLARQRGPVSLDDLAALVAARDGDQRLVDVSETASRDVATELAHSHLPALADAELVTYDRTAKTAEIATDAPQWRADWLAASPLGEIPDRLGLSPEQCHAPPTTASHAGTCWTIEGAENIVARGHEIADTADDELFVTVPDDGFLQQRCLERWNAAAERGVDVFVGSRSPDVRDIVRDAVPSATVCEPQFDWLNFPVDRLDHGRVVFADRKRVMLVTAEESDPEKRPSATAITGEGSTNALVSLVREHVGPRLDRLDSTPLEREECDGTTPLPM